MLIKKGTEILITGTSMNKVVTVTDDIDTSNLMKNSAICINKMIYGIESFELNFNSRFEYHIKLKQHSCGLYVTEDNAIYEPIF